MKPEQWRKIERLYNSVIALEPDRREAFILEACSGDEFVAAEVRRLVELEPDAKEFIESPAMEMVAQKLASESEPSKGYPSMAGKIVSHYRAIEKLGGGGMGIVYKAEDISLHRAAALKFLTGEALDNSAARERFLREARAAAALNHPSICTIYEIGEHEGQHFIAMELLEGQNLRQRIEDRSFQVDELLDLAIQIADGLHTAHAKGIIHRDIKPANIFITNSGQAKILDFGLAKLLSMRDRSPDSTIRIDGQSLTGPGLALGTVAYMSPEQVRGEELDARSDIFSFGVVLYEMATRCQAFQGSTSAMVFDSILHKTPSSPRSLNSKIPEELERITFKALEKDREVRYQSAKEVFADLKRLKRDSDSEKLKAQAGVRFSFPRRIPRVGWISGSIILIIFAVLFLFWNRSAFFHRDSLLGKTAHHRITFTGDALMPAVSPDGLFVSYIAGKRGDPQRLMLQDLAGNPPVKLIDSYYLRAPRWSPDGSQILVCDVQLGEGGFAFPSILLVPRLGQSSRRIADGASACWSPDGTEIAIGFAAGKGPGFRLVNALTGVVREIPLSGFRIVADLDWSRTANRLLILGLLDKGRAIWTVRPDGTDLTKLVEEQEIACARWSSSGDAIYYLRNAGSTPELAKIPIASSPAKSEPSVLLGGLEAGEYFTLSSNGARLLYTRAQASSNLWLAEFTLNAAENKTKTRALTSGTSSLGQPSISPDGKWIAFVNMRENANIYRMPIDGGQSTQLTFTSGFAPAWSPDGTQIAFGSTEGGKNRVWTVRADGLSRRALNKTILSDNYQLTWAPGRRILYQVPSADNFKILDPVTGEEEFLLKGGFLGWIFNPRYSPDGTIVAVWWNRKVRSEIGIYLISLKDRSVKALTKGDIRPVSWSPDGNTVYAFRSFTGEIVAIPVAGGNPRNVLTLPGRITDATVSLDGRKIVGSVAEEKSDVWLMENFDPHP